MIVVPSFAERDQRHKKIVATIIAGGEAAFAENVRQRIDSEGAVIEHDGADEECPDKHLPTGGAEAGRISLERQAQQKCGNCQHDWRQRVVSIQKPQFRILTEVGDQFPFGPLAVAGEEPAKVCAPKPASQRGMEVQLRIGNKVMPPVMCRPPERALLIRGGSGERYQELK